MFSIFISDGGKTEADVGGGGESVVTSSVVDSGVSSAESGARLETTV